MKPHSKAGYPANRDPIPANRCRRLQVGLQPVSTWQMQVGATEVGVMQNGEPCKTSIHLVLDAAFVESPVISVYFGFPGTPLKGGRNNAKFRF